jgi:hypothetical protein
MAGIELCDTAIEELIGSPTKQLSTSGKNKKIWATAGVE